MAVLLHPTKIKRVLFGYWLGVPLLFGLYIFILAAVRNVSAVTIFTRIPSLTLASIIVFLLFFQLFGLAVIGHSSDCRHSLLGLYVRFNMFQQLCTFNIPGFFLCVLFYRSLLDGKEEVALTKQAQLVMYVLMGFVGLMTILTVWLRLSL
ncbi:hypothetical protein [Enterococcus caccae]|uniref:Uncharacterized protein n=1 Tax=Enterococcus caccae ATCC BAA-1240 TaxID=1158612 RepID=R3WDD9_9ENTE|nr:hypothetical protein [Enterococcus caccae]EOL45896.1 hypothetical protein UC7_01693 [Enterococcus caccae ATCC BAA-1240]EOT61092.1 hypothetical protein I580_01994 [Enterococcus caccae ATCC BAA-1240]OJG27877.1 hypothetical protein RU98_GL002086 [Enterococcus caccae]